MWRCRNNIIRLDGLAGQFVMLFPDKDAFIGLTTNARNTQNALDLVHNYLFTAIKSELESKISGKEFDLAKTTTIFGQCISLLIEMDAVLH